MLHMVYAEWHHYSEGCIVNFIEGFENARSWAKHFFDQHHDTIPLYAEFHWQPIPVRVYYALEREFNFHPDKPVYFISNGFGTCIVVPIDGDFDTEELKKIKEIDAEAYPWSHIIEALVVRNEKELMRRFA